MSFVQDTQYLTVTTAADGSATAYLPNATNDGAGLTITGRIVAIEYVKVDFASGVDFTITLEKTGETVWTQLNVDASVNVYPSILTNDNAGVAQTTLDYIRANNDRLKIVIANGGNVKTGKFRVRWE